MALSFVADVMLEKTARWLRLLGFDVKKLIMQEDETLLLYAKQNSLTLLTCDKELFKKAVLSEVDALLIPDDSFERQVAFVLETYGCSIPERIKPTRCPLCNGLLNLAKRSEVKGKVPNKVYKTHSTFWTCNGCNKVYWKGTHWNRIKKTFKKIKKMKKHI